VIARQEKLPAASYARTVITVFPTRRGTEADHAVVPDAKPVSRFDVLHRTEAALGAAVPLTVRLAAAVATMVAAGAVIASDGGVPPEGVGAGFEGGVVGGVVGGFDGGFDGGLDGGAVPPPVGDEPPDGVPPVPAPADPYRS
jgi:hypothetical protein